jgi:hypothetical protein
MLDKQTLLNSFRSLASFYLLLLGVEGYCCICSYSRSNTHTYTRYNSPVLVISPQQQSLTTNNTHNRQKSMSPTGFETEILASEPPLTHALNRAATGSSVKNTIYIKTAYGHGLLTCCLTWSPCSWSLNIQLVDPNDTQNITSYTNVYMLKSLLEEKSNK